jgi:hypothetical protein
VYAWTPLWHIALLLRGRAFISLLILQFAALDAQVASAGDAAPKATVWSGVIASDRSWVAFSGATAAPFGDLHRPGLRLRATGGVGGYTYCFRRSACTDQDNLRGRATFSDVLAGYTLQNGALTTAVFVGAAFVGHDLERPAPHMASGPQWGPKLAVELWYDNGGPFWVSINSSATTAHNTYSWRGRAGYRVMPDLAIGPEFTIDGNGLQFAALGANRDVLLRSGAFARYTWANSELSVSAGIAGGLSRAETSAYGSLTWATKF